MNLICFSAPSSSSTSRSLIYYESAKNNTVAIVTAKAGPRADKEQVMPVSCHHSSFHLRGWIGYRICYLPQLLRKYFTRFPKNVVVCYTVVINIVKYTI